MSVVIVCCQLSINMRRTLKFILWITILLFGAGLYSMNTDFLAYEMSLPDTEQPVVPDDTVPKVRTRFPVAKTVPEAVSYTHLDVYKRQHQGCSIKKQENGSLSIS